MSARLFLGAVGAFRDLHDAQAAREALRHQGFADEEVGLLRGPVPAAVLDRLGVEASEREHYLGLLRAGFSLVVVCAPDRMLEACSLLRTFNYTELGCGRGAGRVGR